MASVASSKLLTYKRLTSKAQEMRILKPKTWVPSRSELKKIHLMVGCTCHLSPKSWSDWV